MVAPEEACLNSSDWPRRGMTEDSASTKPSTTRRRACRAASRSAVVRSFMAHHQGMSLLSLAYLLLDRPMQKRFESDPLFQATMLLLQERIPKATPFYCTPTEISGSQRDFQWSGDAGARFHQP